MLHIFLRDDIKFSDIPKEKSFAVLSTVNVTNQTTEPDSRKIDGKLHRGIRFLEFLNFTEKFNYLLENGIEDLYLKYGGLCFLYDNDLNRYQVYEAHLKKVIQLPLEVDILHNNLILQNPKTSTAAILDKIILERIFLEKDTSLLYYRPSKELKNLSKDEIVDIFKDCTSMVIKNHKYFTCIREL